MPNLSLGLSTGLTTLATADHALHAARRDDAPPGSAPGDRRAAPADGASAYARARHARSSFLAAGLHTGVLSGEYAKKFVVAFRPDTPAGTAVADKTKLSTDPATPEGEAWLRGEFDKIRANVTDEASKPSYDTLERVISGNFKPIRERTTNEVYWEHILLRYVGNVPLDIERNYSEKLKLSLIGSAERILHGHDGIAESARILNELLATTQYTIVDTIMRDTGKESGWVTERWAYLDGNEKHNQVLDGIDSFLIKEGRIDTKMINYTVEPATPPASFYTALGVSHPTHNPGVD